MLLGMALFFITVVTSPKGIFLAVGLSGLPLACAAFIYTLVKGRCVHCGKLLSRAFINPPFPMNISYEFQYCPFCGTSLDLPSGKSNVK